MTSSAVDPATANSLKVATILTKSRRVTTERAKMRPLTLRPLNRCAIWGVKTCGRVQGAMLTLQAASGAAEFAVRVVRKQRASCSGSSLASRPARAMRASSSQVVLLPRRCNQRGDGPYHQPVARPGTGPGFAPRTRQRRPPRDGQKQRAEPSGDGDGESRIVGRVDGDSPAAATKAPARSRRTGAHKGVPSGDPDVQPLVEIAAVKLLEMVAALDGAARNDQPEQSGKRRQSHSPASALRGCHGLAGNRCRKRRQSGDAPPRRR